MLKKIRIIMLLLLFLIGCGGVAYAMAADTESSQGTQVLYEGMPSSEKPLRLHVLANSDSVYDQQLKLAVRDLAIVLLEDVLSSSANKTEAMVAVENALPDLEAACNAFLEEDVDYQASAALECVDFPAIDYNGTIYAAGEYDALRIVLGAGEGHNWWCVLFPPLCFVDLVTELDEQAVTAVMAGEESAGSGYRIAWKWQQWFGGESR